MLQQLKDYQRREGRPMGQLASELLAKALADTTEEQPSLEWISRPMRAQVDLEDRDAVERLSGDQYQAVR